MAMPPGHSNDSTRRRAALKERAATARAHAAATQSWLAHLTAAAAGTVWRVTSAWIEQSDGTFCAELTHVSSGKTRTLRLSDRDTVEGCRARILAE
jgi:hypothetical protein